MRVRVAVTAGLLAAAGLVVGAPADAGTVPSGYADVLVADGLSDPTAMEIAPDGRIVVAEQGGQLRVIKNGTLLATPMLSLSVDSDGERGLLGVAFDPNFPASSYVYVYYTVPGSPAHNRVSRFTVSGDVVTGGSEVQLLNLDNLSSATNHNGGAIHFGADGKLYVAVGENANAANSQTLGNRLGKMLRINADGSIPADNPFFNTASGANRAIWALGLRNPFTFAFQPATGRLHINDVGQNTWEEINRGVSGSNYGWPTTEGPTTDPAFRSPIHAYRHDGSPGRCAIAGGTFYDPTFRRFPTALVNDYFFADLCAGWIRSFDIATKSASAFAGGLSNPVDLKVGNAGSLYYLERGTGSVREIRRTGGLTFRLNDQIDGSAPEHRVRLGTRSSKVLACDWDGNGTDTPAVVRDGIWSLTNTDSGDAVKAGFAYGQPTDIPICGDWDGNGIDSPGVRRGTTWRLRNSNTSGAPDLVFDLGRSTDLPVVGNWDGSGGDGVGVFRDGSFLLANALNGTRDIAKFTFGQAGDAPLAGDWNGDGTSTVGVRRGTNFRVRNANAAGPPDVSVTYGLATDTSIVGDWNGNGTTTIGTVRAD